MELIRHRRLLPPDGGVLGGYFQIVSALSSCGSALGDVVLGSHSWVTSSVLLLGGHSWIISLHTVTELLDHTVLALSSCPSGSAAPVSSRLFVQRLADLTSAPSSSWAARFSTAALGFLGQLLRAPFLHMLSAPSFIVPLPSAAPLRDVGDHLSDHGIIETHGAATVSCFIMAPGFGLVATSSASTASSRS